MLGGDFASTTADAAAYKYNGSLVWYPFDVTSLVPVGLRLPSNYGWVSSAPDENQHNQDDSTSSMCTVHRPRVPSAGHR